MYRHPCVPFGLTLRRRRTRVALTGTLLNLQDALDMWAFPKETTNGGRAADTVSVNGKMGRRSYPPAGPLTRHRECAQQPLENRRERSRPAGDVLEAVRGRKRKGKKEGEKLVVGHPSLGIIDTMVANSR